MLLIRMIVLISIILILMIIKKSDAFQLMTS